MGVEIAQEKRGTLVQFDAKSQVMLVPGKFLSLAERQALNSYLHNVLERTALEWLCADDEQRKEMEHIAFVRNGGTMAPDAGDGYEVVEYDSQDSNKTAKAQKGGDPDADIKKMLGIG